MTMRERRRRPRSGRRRRRRGDGGVHGAADQTAPLKTGTLVRNVAGPASAVVDILEAEGISAEVSPDDGSVTAQGTAADVRAALEGRPGGTVAVYVRWK